MKTNLSIPGVIQKQVIIELSWFGSTPTEIESSGERDHFINIDQLGFDLGIVRLDIAIFGEEETQRQKYWRA